MSTPAMPGLALILSGPSGVGKSTVCRHLFQQLPEARFSVSCATRPPRPGEIQDRDYHFICQEEFLRRRDNGDFLEWAQVHGNFYGTLWAEVLPTLQNGGVIILDIDVQGAATIRNNLRGKAWRRQFLSVFCAPPSFSDLESRLRHRGTEDDATILKRLANARGELARWQEYDFLLVNQDPLLCSQQLLAILTSATLRTELVEPPEHWELNQEPRQ